MMIDRTERETYNKNNPKWSESLGVLHMNDLLNTLYDYVLTQSESYLAVYPEYRDFCRRAAEKERSLRANLSQEDEQLLEDMLGELWLRHQAEQEAAFRAALALCRELNRAVLA